MLRSIEVVNAAISADNMLLTRAAHFGVLQHRLVELLIVAHGVLEHADRARQRADLVAACAVGNCHRGAFGDLLGHARDLGERMHHGAPEHQRTECASRIAIPPSRLISQAVKSMPESIFA